MFPSSFSNEYLTGVKQFLSCDLKKLRAAREKCQDSRERKLLTARELILENKSNEAISLLEPLSEFSPHIRAEKHLQLASLYSIQSQHERAITENLKALPFFKETKNTARVYAIYYNLSVDASLMRLRELALHFIDEAEKLAAHPEEFLEIARARACHYSQLGQFEKALSILKDAENNLKKAPRLDAATFNLVAADICIRAHELKKAQAYLKRVSTQRHYSNSSRARIQMKLLRFLASDEQSLVSAKKIPRPAQNEYSLQWNCLVQIQNGEISEAEATWNELRKLRPRVYGGFLKNNEEHERHALFFQCVSKLTRKNAHSIEADGHLPGLSKKLQLAYELLLKSPTPLRKEELIEKLWNIPYSSEFDSRFYKLIERLKSKIPHEIVQRNRSYFLAS